MKLTIDRLEWLRGEGPLRSKLLRDSDGKRCCVGIYAQALGVPDEKILDCAWPNRMGEDILIWDSETWWCAEEAPWLHNECAAPGLANINDDPELNEVTREQLITGRFAEHDVEVTFIN